jgi:inosine-uridine nucleoside N-ribohydrolase
MPAELVRIPGDMEKTRLLSVVIVLIGVCAGAISAQFKKVIVDADPAMGYLLKDVDNILTLPMALNSPELEILSITATCGNVKQHRAYAKAAETLEQAGRADIPLHSGARGPESLGRATPASRLIVDTIRACPGEVTILALGPLTNVATAIHSDPQLIELTKEVVSIGGTITALGEYTHGNTRLRYCRSLGASVPAMAANTSYRRRVGLATLE